MLTERFDTAMVYASSLHRDQVRKGSGVPYLSHLLAVTAMVIEEGGSEDQAVAALLHDVIEDCSHQFPGGREALRADIKEKFGENVLQIVNACTDDDGFEKNRDWNREEAARQWRIRKEAYIARLATESESMLLVSCADKLHNARSILKDYRTDGEDLWRRFASGKKEDQAWYYESLVRVYRERGVGRLATMLEETVARWETAEAFPGEEPDAQTRL